MAQNFSCTLLIGSATDGNPLLASRRSSALQRNRPAYLPASLERRQASPYGGRRAGAGPALCPPRAGATHTSRSGGGAEGPDSDSDVEVVGVQDRPSVWTPSAVGEARGALSYLAYPDCLRPRPERRGWDELPAPVISEERRSCFVRGKDCEREVVGDWEEDVEEVRSVLGRKGSQSWRFWFSQR